MKILFIGNSHTFVHSMPAIVQELMQFNNIACDVVMLTRGGMNYKYHVENSQTKFNIQYGHYDYVVLQNCAHPMEDLEVMWEYGKQLVAWCNEFGSTPILYQTWAAKKDGAAFQPTMSDSYTKLSEMTGAKIAPVGDTWWKYNAKYPEDDLYYEDGEHSSIIGATLAAYVISKTILGFDVKPHNEIGENIVTVL